MSLKALIVEDEAAAARRLQKMILELEPATNIVGRLDSVAETLKWFKENPQPDVLFLDINLGDGLSFEILEKVEIHCPVIFTTAYDEYAIKAFKTNSIDYLLKPIKADELEFSFKKLHKLRTHYMSQADSIQQLLSSVKSGEDTYKKRFVVNFGDKIKAIETSDIAYFMVLEKSTFLVTHNNDSFGINYSLDQLEHLLRPDDFFRVNRKFIISFKAIINMWSYSRSRVKLQLKPETPEEVIVSTDRSSGFKLWLDT